MSSWRQRGLPVCKVIEDMLKEERAEVWADGVAAIIESLSVPTEEAIDLLAIPSDERSTLMEILSNT